MMALEHPLSLGEARAQARELQGRVLPGDRGIRLSFNHTLVKATLHSLVEARP